MDPIENIRTQLQSALILLDDVKHMSDQDERPGSLPYKVIHLRDNPFQRQLDRRKREIKRLREENERINAKLELLESGNDADVTRRIDDAVNNAHEVEILKRKLDEYEKRETKILTSFRKTSREFREVCYLLTGYRIDALKDGIYRLSHMYAESQSDVLLFEIAPHGEIQLLKNDYTDKISKFVNTYLEQGDSFPAFLSSITLDLFKSSTQVFQVSMNISTRNATAIENVRGR